MRLVPAAIPEYSNEPLELIRRTGTDSERTCGKVA